MRRTPLHWACQQVNFIINGVEIFNFLQGHVRCVELLVDAMDEQLDRVKGEIKTRNRQMREVLKRMGSTSNVCMDITLIVILVALAAYIYSLLA